MLKPVIFDFNGTLFMNNEKHVKAWSRISEEMRGRPITEHELHEKMNGKPNKQIIRYLNGGKEDEELENRYSLLKEQYYREFCREDKENFHLVKGAEQLFDDLKSRGVPFTIASASIRPNIDFLVESFHLDRWMNPDLIVYDDGRYIDKVGMFEKASEYLGVPLTDTTVIEDSLAGISCAVRCGVKDIRVLDSGNLSGRIKDIPQIRQIVHGMDEIVR